MLIKCQKCKEIFDSDDLKLDYTEGGYRGEPHYSCPYCGDDQWEWVEQCSRCGKYFSLDTYDCHIHGTSGSMMCDDCIDEVADVRTVVDYGYSKYETAEVDGINGLFAYMFSAGEINDILMAHFTQLPEEQQKKWAKDYIKEDLNNFADWYDEGGEN